MQEFKKENVFAKAERSEILVALEDVIQYVRVVSWNASLRISINKANATMLVWLQSFTSAKPASSSTHFLRKSTFGIFKMEWRFLSKTLTVYYAISHLFLVMLQVDINKKKGGRGETLNLAIFGWNLF